MDTTKTAATAAETATEREAWEAQVDEAVAVVSILGEERAALLAKRRKRGGGGGGGGKGNKDDGDDDDDDDDEGDKDGDDFAAIDVGDEAEISRLREAGFRVAGPLQLRLLVDVEIAPAGGEIGSGRGSGNGSVGEIALTVGGADAAASVSLLQPLRLAVALPRGYLMPTPQQKIPEEEEEEEEEEDKNSSVVPAVSVSAPWLSAAAAARLERRAASLSSRLLSTSGGELDSPLPVVSELVEFLSGSAVAEALGGGCCLDLLEVVGGGGGGEDDDDGDDKEEKEEEVEEEENDDDEDEDEDSLVSAALALLRQLLSDDAALSRERFLCRSDHSCPICLESGISGEHATELTCCSRTRKEKKKDENDENGVDADVPSSSRSACDGCLRTLCESALRAKDASLLVCPFPDCRQPLSPSTLSHLLGAEKAEAAEELRLERALRSLGCRTCPHCGFSGVVADGQGCCICPRPSCRFAFCGECFDSWHAGGKGACTDPEARLMLARARTSGSSSSSSSNSNSNNDRESARALRRAEEEFLSLSLISRSGFKPCPACKTPIERTSGCNRMRCGACSTSFCFSCSAVIGDGEGYAHFGAGRCALLSDAEVARLRNEEMAADGGAAIAAAAAAADRNAFWLGVAREQRQRQRDNGGGATATGTATAASSSSSSSRGRRVVRVSRCPTCKAPHAGESNDRRCQCKTRHCGACGERIVRRRGEASHFGRPPKCPEHF